MYFFASFLNLVFMLMYGFNHAFWLNWITLYTFFSINPWFSAYFKVLMWTTYFSFSRMLQTSLLHFLVFSLSGKNGKSIWRLNKLFWILNIYFKKISLITVFAITIYEILTNLENLFIHLKPFTRSFWDIRF